MRLFSVFPEFVREELGRRRDRDELQRPKSTWMRMTSNFKPADGSDRQILMGGTLDVGDRLKFGFEELYGRDTDTGEKRRPQPTINSISVDEKLESVEATVEWTAYSVDQVETFFPSFMNLGNTVLLDWGWSDVPPGAITNVEDEGEILSLFRNLTPNLSEENAPEDSPPFVNRFDHPRYDKYRNGEGRYSLIAGNIVDFSFSPSGDGEWSCTTELQSISNSMIGLRNRTQLNRRQGEEGGDERNTVKKTLFEFMDEDFAKWLESNSGSGDVVLLSNKNIGDKQIVRNKDALGTDPGQAYYIAWNKVEDLVNRYAQYRKGNENTESDIRLLNLDSGTSIISNLQAEVQSIGGGLPTSTNLATGGGTRSLNLRSTSPLVCLVNSGQGKNIALRELSEQSPVEDHFDFDEFDIDSSRQGFLYNLYVNADLLIDAFKTKKKMFDSLEWVLERCSAACFNIWDFEIIDDMGTYRFIDRNAIQNRTVSKITNTEEPPNPFTFLPATSDSVLRDFNIDTNLDDMIKQQVTAQNATNLGGSSSNAAHNNQEDSTAQFFNQINGQDLVLSEMQRPKSNESSQPSDGSDPGEFDFQPKTIPIDPSVIDSSQEELEDISPLYNEGSFFQARRVNLSDLVYPTDSTISTARLFDRALQADTSGLSARNANKTVNLNAQITVDGVSGLSTYQAFQITNIPRIISTQGLFSIDHITHNVGSDDWTTEIKAKFVAKNLATIDSPSAIFETTLVNGEETTVLINL